MPTRLICALLALTMIAGCGRVAESRLNPFNWFGGSEATQTVTTTASQQRQNLIVQVTSLRVEQVPGGAIIRATGLPQRQGYFDGRLEPVGREVAAEGVLNYEFLIESPLDQTLVGPETSREVIVGRFVSEQALAGVRQIRVSGRANALSVRR
ncbi:MAG: hypothetical protein AAGP08_06570 [Pseudomonadota bacterium]